MLAMSRRDSLFLLRYTTYLIIFSVIIGSSFALAQSVTFGARTLNMPAPTGFVAIAKMAPNYMQAAQSYLPPGNRLVESFVPAEAAQALTDGKAAVLDRYFQLQTLRKADGLALSADDFQGATAEIEASFAKALKEVDVDKLTREGNAQLKKMTATDPKLELSAIESQGVYRREPWGIFFTVKSRVALGASGESSDLICAGALALINHQLMYLNGYTQLKNDDDRRWVQQAVSSWADAVHVANPDDPTVAAQSQPLGFGWGRLNKNILTGAAIGGLLGVIAVLLRRRKR